jgi:hypothetical protein
LGNILGDLRFLKHLRRKIKRKYWRFFAHNIGFEKQMSNFSPKIGKNWQK